MRHIRAALAKEATVRFLVAGRRKPAIMLFWVVEVLLLGWAHGLWAQLPTGAGLGTDPLRSNVGAYYYMARPGDLTVIVSIWGEVRNPGQYEVPVGTELIQLLSYAGGPLVSADLRRIRIIRREANGKHYESVLTVDVSRLVDSPDRIPTIQPGDVIVVGRRSSVVFAQEIMPVFRDVIFLALYLLISLNTLGVF